MESYVFCDIRKLVQRPLYKMTVLKYFLSYIHIISKIIVINNYNIYFIMSSLYIYNNIFQSEFYILFVSQIKIIKIAFNIFFK